MNLGAPTPLAPNAVRAHHAAFAPWLSYIHFRHTLSLAHVVDVALAEAFSKAAALSRFDVVVLLAWELEVRRIARELPAAVVVVVADVLDIDTKRRKHDP